MTELKLLENRLRGWKPRRPSPSLKARLFAPPGGPAEEVHASVAWGWLAPALATFVAGMVMFGRHPGGLGEFQPSLSPAVMASAALSHPQMAAYYASDGPVERNALTRTFAWTNRERSVSTPPFALSTNGLMP
jgi:hypothetical protein